MYFGWYLRLNTACPCRKQRDQKEVASPHRSPNRLGLTEHLS